MRKVRRLGISWRFWVMLPSLALFGGGAGGFAGVFLWLDRGIGLTWVGNAIFGTLGGTILGVVMALGVELIWARAEAQEANEARARLELQDAFEVSHEDTSFREARPPIQG